MVHDVCLLLLGLFNGRDLLDVRSLFHLALGLRCGLSLSFCLNVLLAAMLWVAVNKAGMGISVGGTGDTIGHGKWGKDDVQPLGLRYVKNFDHRIVRLLTRGTVQLLG